MTFTPYVGLVSPLPLVVALVLRRWAVAAGALVVVAAFALALLPRAFAGPRPAVRDGVTVRVMASNLYTTGADPRAVVERVRRDQVDVLALVELTPRMLARLDRAGLGRLLPHRQYDAGRGGGSGAGLFTRWPMRRRAPSTSRPSQAQPRGLIAVPGGAMPVDLQVIHPLPPINASWRAIWNAMLGALHRPDGGPALRVLAGDFNATLDHRRLRRLLGGGARDYVDAADATGQGYRTTWPAGRRFPPEITIDHVLVDPRVRVEELAVHTIPGSDHRAVVATLTLPRAPRAPAAP